MQIFIDGIKQRQWLQVMREPLSLREAAPLFDVHYNTLLAWEKEQRALTTEEIAIVRTVHRCILRWRRWGDVSCEYY